MKYLKLFDNWQNTICNYAFRGEKANHNPPFGGSGYYKGTYFYIGNDALINAKNAGDIVIIANIQHAELYLLNTPELLKKEAKSAGYNIREGSGYPECDYLKNIGYDGIRIGKEVVLFDKDKFLIK